MDNRTWFKEAGFGMMVHWGLYSVLGGQYKGKIARPYAEWIQSRFAIPNREYEQLATVFNPIFFDVLPPHTRDFSRELGGRAFYLQGLNSYGIN